MKRRTFLTTSIATATLLTAGCTGDGGGGSSGDGGSDADSGDGDTAVVQTSDVAMVNTQFDPRNIHVGTGTTVTWTNEDDFAHTVTSASDNWSKDTEVAGGKTTTHTFEQSGVYDVYCRFHGSSDLSGMSMKVGVGDAAIESPLGSGDSGGYEGGAY